MYRATDSHKKRDIKLGLKVKGGLYVPSFKTSINWSNVVQAKTSDVVNLLQATLVVDTALIIPQFDSKYTNVNSKFGPMVGKVLSTPTGPKKVLGVVNDSKGTARVAVEAVPPRTQVTEITDDYTDIKFRYLFAEVTVKKDRTSLVTGKGREPESPIALSLLRIESVNEKADQESSFERQQPSQEELDNLMNLPRIGYTGDLNELLRIRANIKDCYKYATGEFREELKKVFEHLAVVSRNGVSIAR